MTHFDRYLLDDMEIREFTVYLEQFYCNPDQDRCPGQIVNYFPTMHRMAMEKYKIRSLQDYLTYSIFLDFSSPLTFATRSQSVEQPDQLINHQPNQASK